MPRGGAGGQSLGHLKKCKAAFSFMLTPFKDIMSDISHPYGLDLFAGEGQSDLYFMIV